MAATGNDTNDGTIGAPWKTLARANVQAYVRGDRVLLKCGDTFTGQFVPSGNGVFDLGTFMSTFNNTQASAQTTYTGDGTYAGVHTAGANAGMSSTLQDSAATQTCRLLGVRDAMVASLPAVDGSVNNQWITLGSYGTGARPIIDATGFDAAVELSSMTSGWKVSGAEIKNPRCAGIHADTGGHSYGLWIDNCNIHDIDPNNLMPIPSGSNTPQVPGFRNAWPAGVQVYGVNQVFMTNTTITNTGVAYQFFLASYYLVDNCLCDTSKYQGTWWVGTSSQLNSYGVIRGSHMTNLGTLSWPFGTEGMGFAHCDSLVIDTCEIDNINAANSDAECLDFEGVQSRVLVNNCNLHDTYGSSTQTILASKSSFIFRNNTLTRNGTGATATKPCGLKTDGLIDYCLWTGTMTTRASADNSQKFFLYPIVSGTFSDSPPAGSNCYYDPNNTITPP